MVEMRITKYTPGTVRVLNEYTRNPYNNGIDSRIIPNNDEELYCTIKRNQELYERFKTLENIYIPEISKIGLARLCIEEFLENENKQSQYSMSIMNGGLFQEWNRNDFDQ